MAGTDSTRSGAQADKEAISPAIILVDPQLGENIGMAARAMLNCALFDLRLVRPRDGWPNEKAVSAACGADAVLERLRLHETAADAVADLQRVYAATARPRDMTKEVVTPRQAASDMRRLTAAGVRCGILFGAEAKGLDNDDVALADAVLTVPLNPGFSSLNLANAVFTIGYEWFQGADRTAAATLSLPKETRPANKAEMLAFFEHMEKELDACGFLRVKEKRPVMVRNLRNLFQRARLSEQEVRTLRGVISGLVKGKKNTD
ncbi:MAG TPA: RNA methyltransferase [Rhodospirillales bacterium]|jgi:tRNA/rRNA methyltransferase|nr:RNA methyltransferase [Rhodospirillales bacterium]